MTINLIIPNYMPENLAGSNRMKVFIEKLSEKHNINLITLKKSNETKKINKFLEEFNVDNIFLIENNKFYKNNFILRAINEILFSIKLYKLSKTISADIIISTSPSMFIIPVLSFENRKKIIDIRDVVWEYLQNPLIKKFLSYLIHTSLKKYNKVIITNVYEKKLLSDFNPILISNGIEKNKFEKLSQLNPTSKNMVVTYIGNIGIAQNVMTLVQAATKLHDIEFRIVGDGVDFKKIQRFVKENNLNNVILYGKKNWYEILEIYKETTILWAQLMDNFDSAMPSKLYEYSSTGLPIIYGGSGIAKDFLQNLENCFIHRSGNYEELIEILTSLKSVTFEKSKKNIEFIKKHYIRENEAEKLLKVMDIL